MPRAIWSGSLSFGLVNVPVKVVTAVRQKEVKFNQIHVKDGGRIEYKRVCSVDGEEVPFDEIVKGHKVGPEDYVTLTKEEVESLAPERSETIDIVDFVDLHEIDPIYFEKPYYLVPEKGATKAYRLLLEAMRDKERIAIARVVMRSREHLVAVRPVGEALAMTTLNYHDEIVDQADLEMPEAPRVGDKELKMAEQLIEALTSPFDPTKYTDEYRQQLLTLIDAKAEGREVVTAPREKPQPAKDLVEALQASLEAARRTRGEGHAEA